MKKKSEINFNNLVEIIQQIHKELAQQASYAVNVSLTLRNWMIGGYIHKYELLGSDRAKYGDKLIEKLGILHLPVYTFLMSVLVWFPWLGVATHMVCIRTQEYGNEKYHFAPFAPFCG